MDQAEESLRRMVDFLARLETVTAEGEAREIEAFVATAREDFAGAMHDDLNTSAALAAIFELINKVNVAIDAKTVTRAGVALVVSALADFDKVLGIVALRRAEDAQPPVPVEEIERLIDERKAARARRDFAAADQIRVALADRGILLEDNPSGTRWKKK